MYILENEEYILKIKRVGAELCSFRSKQNDIEYIWPGDPKFWGYHSPTLFPIVGRLKTDSFRFDDRTYFIPKHGFVRDNKKIKLTEISKTSLLFRLSYDGNTLRLFPFFFEFIIQYDLIGSKLAVRYTVLNQGSSEMYFSIGAHPAFNCSLNKNIVFENCFLEFEKVELCKTWKATTEGLLDEEGHTILNKSKILKLNYDLFKNDALIFKNIKSDYLYLKSEKSSLNTKLNFGQFPYLAIWTKPDSNFICIEPWAGLPDTKFSNQMLNKKEGIITLKGKSEYTISYSIDVSSNF